MEYGVIRSLLGWNVAFFPYSVYRTFRSNLLQRHGTVLCGAGCAEPSINNLVSWNQQSGSKGFALSDGGSLNEGAEGSGLDESRMDPYWG